MHPSSDPPPRRMSLDLKKNGQSVEGFRQNEKSWTKVPCHAWTVVPSSDVQDAGDVISHIELIKWF